MAVENLKEKLAKIVSNEPSNWLEEVRWRIDNHPWIERSQSVALKILQTLREESLSQKELAERLHVSPQQVSKWVKGSENFTLETISRIESALGIELIAVPRFEVKQANSVKKTVSRSSRNTAEEVKEKI